MSKAQTGGGRLHAMRLLALVLAPIVFFALTESVLAVVGFGGHPALFTASVHWPGHREANPDVVQRYFPGRATQLGIEAIAFSDEKDPGSVRIVVQGGSTAAGFPYGRWAGLAGMLGDRLDAARPESKIEVITTAMAAVNSYSLLDFVDEIIAIEPDAVLIYAGHNEYLGIFGAGSALTKQRSRVATRAHLWLSRLRTYQLIDAMIPSAAEAAKEAEGAEAGRRDTLMARAASSAEIPFDSTLYHEGLLQFEENLDAILARYERAGIPVFVGTLVSNEADQAPFAGGPAREADRAAFDAALREAQTRRRAGAIAHARAALEALLERHPRAAAAWFELGEVERAAGNVDSARASYRKAKELDRLRFRAPEAISDIVRARAAARAARVVDVEAHLAARSPLGIVGEELMLEHLHPNARGYFLLADAYYDAVEAAGLFGGPPAQPPPIRAQAQRDMPITAIDRLNAAQAMREIRADFPFRKERIEVEYPAPRGPIEQIAKRVYEDPTQWLAGMEELLQFHLDREHFAKATVIARVTAQALPWEAAPNRAAARLLERGGRLRQAVRYLERAIEADSDDPATLRRLERLQRVLANRQERAP